MIAVRGRLAELSSAQRAFLLDRRPTYEPDVREKVTRILLQVRSRGDEALLEVDGETFTGCQLQR